MDLTLTADQKELISWAEDLIREEFPLDRFAEVDGPIDERGIEKLAELGWHGLGLPESAGGSGLTAVEEALLAQIAGRGLPGPRLIANTIAAHVALRAGDTEGAQAFVTLSRRAALAFPARAGSHSPGSVEAYVIDHANAENAVLIDGDALYLLPFAAAEATAVQGIDESVLTSRTTLKLSGAVTGDKESWLRAQLMTAAMLVGAAEAALDMATDYAKFREQFGKPIGAYQAIKHKCANMALEIASARSQCVFAAVSLHEGRADAEFHIRAARVLAGAAAKTSAYGNVQIHGGIGFHAECDAQRFVKRTTLLNILGGGTSVHRDALLAGAGDPEALGEIARVAA